MADWSMSRNARRPLPTRSWTIAARRSSPAAEEFGENVLIVESENERIGRRKRQDKRRRLPKRSTLTAKDKKTLGSIRDLADDVVQSAERGRAPYVDIPSRSLSNVRFNQSKRIIEMGSGTNRRELFNLNSGARATCRRCWSAPDASS